MKIILIALTAAIILCAAPAKPVPLTCMDQHETAALCLRLVRA